LAIVLDLKNMARIISFNVNGIRAAAKKGFSDWLDNSAADIVGLQEVRSPLHNIPVGLESRPGWHTHYVCAARKGYSGVGILSRLHFDGIETSLDDTKFDSEARLQIAKFGELMVANVYFPNGKGKNDDNSRIPFKLEFYARLFDCLAEVRKSNPRLLVMGDFNTAHTEIDLARPKENVNTSGFCLNERQELDRWIAAGYIDTFRCFEQSGGHYTWWSQRARARERNVGWRIDYVMASPEAMPFVTNAFIHADVMGSDHCPVGVDVDNAIFGETASSALSMR
jgi:exodeoxyribonuclease-3